MKKYILTLLTVCIAAFLLISCDDEGVKDVKVKDAPAGEHNLDISGKTFTNEDVAQEIKKNVINYDANGIANGGTVTPVALSRYVRTLVFNADGTFTYTYDHQFTADFDKLYTWSYQSAPTNTAYTTYSNPGYNRTWDSSQSGLDGSTKGDQAATAYSGYAGKTYSKTVYSGTWEAYTVNSDGYDEMTTRYRVKVTKKETSYLDTTDSETGYLPLSYSANYTTTTDTTMADRNSFEELEIELVAVNAEGKNVYDIEIDDANLNEELALQ